MDVSVEVWVECSVVLLAWSWMAGAYCSVADAFMADMLCRCYIYAVVLSSSVLPHGCFDS